MAFRKLQIVCFYRDVDKLRAVSICIPPPGKSVRVERLHRRFGEIKAVKDQRTTQRSDQRPSGSDGKLSSASS